MPHSRSGTHRSPSPPVSRWPSGPGWPGSLWSCGSTWRSPPPSSLGIRLSEQVRQSSRTDDDQSSAAKPASAASSSSASLSAGSCASSSTTQVGTGEGAHSSISSKTGYVSPEAVVRSPCGTPSCRITSPQRRPEEGSGIDCTSMRAGSSRRPQTTSASPSGEMRTAALPSPIPDGSPEAAASPGIFRPYACQARRASGQSWRAVAAIPTFHQSGAPVSRSSRATARRPAVRACSQSWRNLWSRARLNQDSESQGSRSAARVSSAPASS